MWGCFIMSGVKILHFLKDWWKSIPIHQNYTMALNLFIILTHYYRCQRAWSLWIMHVQLKSIHILVNGLINFISLIPRLSHRLSYFTFRTISWSCVSSPTITWLPVRYASVYIIHMYPMCVAQSAARGTVKSELGQWIRITIGCARIEA